MTIIQMHRGTEGMAPVARSVLARWGLVLLGLAGFAGTLALTYTLVGTSSFDYRGGFLLSALSAAAIITAAVCVPRGPIAWTLSRSPLVWLGTISYGAYLWHYPVYVYLDSARTGLSGLSLLAVRFASTLALAAASYYLVERPVMYGTFWRSLKAAVPATVLLGATVAVVIVGTGVPATAAVSVKRYQVHVRDAQPPSLVVLGDSTALTLGAALGATAPPGTTVVNGGLFGCGLAIATNASNTPPQLQLAMFPGVQLRIAGRQAVAGRGRPGGGRHRTGRPGAVRGRKLGGAGPSPEWPVDQYRGAVLPALRALPDAQGSGDRYGARGPLRLHHHARPGRRSRLPRGTVPRGLLGPPDDLRPVDHKVADEFPGSVSVIDYGRLLSPQGVFTEYLDGVQVRTADGVHTPAYSPGNAFVGNSTASVAHAFYNWLAPRIWPLLIASNPSAASTASTASSDQQSRAGRR